MRLRTKLIIGLVFLLAVGAVGAWMYWRYWPSEPSANQHGLVSQMIGRTEVTIDYNRPSARGREPFGDLVAWGQMWHPGGDQAAIVRFSTDVQVNGQPVSAGRYSIWAQPQTDAWTVILSRDASIERVIYPEGQDALRVSVSPRAGAFMDTLAFYFPVVDGRAAELVLHWGRVVVPLQITVS
jgi:hypothetical protein